MNRTILLDLNYTLVSNSTVKARPFWRQIEGETYSAELVQLLRDRDVILITARPARYEMVTLDSIQAKTGWVPGRAAFNHDNLPPPTTKERHLKGWILGEHAPDTLVGIESNPATRAMYARHGIASYTRDQVLADPSLLSS